MRKGITRRGQVENNEYAKWSSEHSLFVPINMGNCHEPNKFSELIGLWEQTDMYFGNRTLLRYKH